MNETLQGMQAGEQQNAQWDDIATGSIEADNPADSIESPKRESVADYIKTAGLMDGERVESLIQTGTYDDFKVHLVRLNALFRNLSPDEHQIDGETVHVADNLVPISSEFKEQVVAQTFDALKYMPPKDRGILMYNVLGAVHLFGDGNGRSMRMWHHILSGEPVDDDSVRVLTEHDNDTQDGIGATGREEMRSYLNTSTFATSGVVNYFASKPILDELGVDNIRSAFPYISLVFDDKTIKSLTIDETSRIKNICRNDTGAFYCPFNIMTMHILKTEDETVVTPSAEIEGSVYMYDNEQNNDLVLNAEQARRFIQINNELKLKYFQTLIDIFKKPDEYKLSNGKPVKDAYFYKREK